MMNRFAVLILIFLSSSIAIAQDDDCVRLSELKNSNYTWIKLFKGFFPLPKNYWAFPGDRLDDKELNFRGGHPFDSNFPKPFGVISIGLYKNWTSFNGGVRASLANKIEMHGLTFEKYVIDIEVSGSIFILKDEEFYISFVGMSEKDIRPLISLYAEGIALSKHIARKCRRPDTQGS